MAVLKSFVALALLAKSVLSVPFLSQQTVLSPGSINVLDSEELILRVNTTFDAVKLKKPENLEGYGYLTFDGYQIFEPEAAVSAGKLNKSDLDCAMSAPNALLLSPPKHPSPFIFRSNATALADRNVSSYFDFVSMAVKPLALNTTYVTATMNAWRIEDGTPKDVQELYIGFYGEGGVFDPWVIEPRAYIDGWGEGANFIEFSEGQDEEGNPVAFCVDNIVLDFHQRSDDE